MDKQTLLNIINQLGLLNVREEDISPFLAEEDGKEYSVWHIKTSDGDYVLKVAKEKELDIYRFFLDKKKSYSPAYYGSYHYEDQDYFLMEYCPGEDLCKCSRDKLIRALDSLIIVEDDFWDNEELSDKGITMDRALKAVEDRGNYLNSELLSEVYKDFIELYKKSPRTLSHEDLLPFNILVSDTRAVIIDWEVGGILPYLSPFARLIAHGREDENYLFFMKKEDYDFAIDYFYDNLVKKHGISYKDYIHDLDYFLFFEYCEWIMLGNRYDNRDDERFSYYMNLATNLAKKLKGKAAEL